RGSSRAVKVVSPMFQMIDRKRAQEATAIAANSVFVRDRIRQAWDRDATVIHPPVAVERIRSQSDWRTQVTNDAEQGLLDNLPTPFILGASRFIPYKRLDLVIAAGEKAGLPVVLAGRGPEEAHLHEMAAAASVPVHIVLSPSD